MVRSEPEANLFGEDFRSAARDSVGPHRGAAPDGGPFLSTRDDPAAGAASGDLASDPAGDLTSPRWEFLRAWVEAIYLDRGTGCGGSVGQRVTAAERRIAREGWNRLMRHWQRAQAAARLDYGPESPAEPEREVAVRHSCRRFGELADELGEWSGAPREAFASLLGETLGWGGE